MTDTLATRAERKLGLGDMDGAYADARSALQQNKHDGRAHFVMSCVALRKGAIGAARKLCEIAIRLDGDTVDNLAQLALCHLHSGDPITALDLVGDVFDAPDAGVATLDNLVQLFHALGLHERALAAAVRQSEMAPGNATVKANLGSLKAICGDTAGATGAFRDALRVDPVQVDALGNLSASRKASAEDNNVDRIETLLASATDARTQIKLHYAIAQEFDDLGHTERVFAHLDAGNAIWANLLAYDGRRDTLMFERLARFTARPAQIRPGTCPARPIFVCGMPRSGSTVVERILTRNSAVRSIGESPVFGQSINAAIGNRTLRPFDDALIESHWDRLPLEDIGRGYSHFGDRATGQAGRVLDKTPLNFHFVPLIAKALPQARIVFVQRDPMDTVLGNYRMLFNLDNPAFGYSSSIEACAVYVAHAHCLAKQFERAYPGIFCRLTYEDLVLSPEMESRRLFKFLNLDWTPDVLDIASNAAPAASASAVQVKEPLQTSHMGKWRRFAPHLAEAAKVFQRAGGSAAP